MTAPIRTRPPASGPEPALELPRFGTHRLDGGLRVEIARTAPIPDVAMRLVLGAGAGTTPP